MDKSGAEGWDQPAVLNKDSLLNSSGVFPSVCIQKFTLRCGVGKADEERNSLRADGSASSAFFPCPRLSELMRIRSGCFDESK